MKFINWLTRHSIQKITRDVLLRYKFLKPKSYQEKDIFLILIKEKYNRANNKLKKEQYGNLIHQLENEIIKITFYDFCMLIGMIEYNYKIEQEKFARLIVIYEIVEFNERLTLLNNYLKINLDVL